MDSPKSAFWQGARAQAPSAFGIAPFGLITGAAASAAGIDPALAIGMSLLIYAGASQLVAIQLLAAGASGLLAIAAVLVVNLRLVMYSAALAPHFMHAPPRRKLLLSYLLTDHNYALLASRFPHPDFPPNQDWFFIGAGTTLWIAWQPTVAAGVFIGAQVPAAWALDFAVPLAFIALLGPMLSTRAHLAAGLAAALAAVLTAGWPLRTGLMAAALAGVAAGLLVEWLHRGHDRERPA